MATRFRLRQTTTAPAVSPALAGAGHTAPATVRRQLLTSDSSALTNTAYTPDAADHGVASEALWCQFVSDQMAAGKVFANGDTIKLAVQGLEAHANNNLFVRVYVRVFSSDGGTLRRHLGNADCSSELTTTLRNNFISFTQSGADYTTVADDRLVVELYVQGTPGGGGGVQGHNSTMRFGSDGGSGDLPENSTETGTGFNPWVEVVPSDLFTAVEEHSGSAAVSGAGTSVAATAKNGQNVATTTAGGVVVAAVLKGALALAVVSGAGAAIGVGDTARSGSAAVSGAGVATAVGEQDSEEHSGSALVGGAGSTTASGEKAAASVSGSSGSGGTSGTGQPGHEASASVAGAGSTTGTGESARSATATASGAGAVVTSAETQRFGTALATGAGDVTASGSAVESHEGVATVSGGGSVVAVGATARAEAQATVSGAGQAVSDGSSQRFGGGSVSGAGQATASGTQASGAQGQTVVSGGGGVVATGSSDRYGQATVSSDGEATAQGGGQRFSQTSVSGAGQTAATGGSSVSAQGSAAVSGAGTMFASGRVDAVTALVQLALALHDGDVTQAGHWLLMNGAMRANRGRMPIRDPLLGSIHRKANAATFARACIQLGVTGPVLEDLKRLGGVA